MQAAGSGGKEGMRQGPAMTSWSCDRDLIAVMLLLFHFVLTVIPYDEARVITLNKEDLEVKIDDVKEPTPPKNVHASEVTEDYVVLSWDEPDPCGKEPVKYYIEKCIEGSNRWERISTSPHSPRFSVMDLEKGKSYCFRVQAANKHGVSDASTASSPISLKATLGDCLHSLYIRFPFKLVYVLDVKSKTYQR
ncbi:unnamed protein product [Ranitomeya imitator]|uniref:Fibronectin type-III domain-containing protein n=1 Tax=Ranitomeya imitator TaxID=111125 RepID=A0ABN9LCU1_9NEOB|nr:unnamed protein product [Ranitomeya imitator]